MYIPRANEETRTSVLHTFMRSQPFASLVTLASTGLFASHIPLVLEEDGTEFGILRGHLSRANTQWKDIDSSVEALAIFTGPNHYITPSWYPSKAEHGKVVPTWNYIVVHAYGTLKLIEDAAWLLAHLNQLTNTHEAGKPVPWKVSDAPADYIASQMKGIVGIELPITRLEGKWKLSQNRSDADRDGAEAGLEALNTPESQSMKLAMKQTR
jgi:transcriptional regulator